MAYLLLDDAMDDHPKLDGLSDRSFRVHISALFHASRNLTDGRISKRTQRILRAKTNAKTTHFEELEAAGLWERDGEDWLIHGYLDHNPSAEQVLERRRRSRERTRKLRANVQANVQANVRLELQDPSPSKDLLPTYLPSPLEDSAGRSVGVANGSIDLGNLGSILGEVDE